MSRLTPTAIARLAQGANWLPDPLDLRVQTGDDLSPPHFLALPVYEALPDLLETMQAQAEEVADARFALSRCYAVLAEHDDGIRLALRLPADAPFTDVLARARHLAEVDADDPLRTRDGEVVGG